MRMTTSLPLLAAFCLFGGRAHAADRVATNCEAFVDKAVAVTYTPWPVAQPGIPPWAEPGTIEVFVKTTGTLDGKVTAVAFHGEEYVDVDEEPRDAELLGEAFVGSSDYFQFRFPLTTIVGEGGVVPVRWQGEFWVTTDAGTRYRVLAGDSARLFAFDQETATFLDALEGVHYVPNYLSGGSYDVGALAKTADFAPSLNPSDCR
jgi:hypothetical protein